MIKITDSEEYLLNHYASSELAGGLILGRRARVEEDINLVKNLLRHSKEEIDHSYRWYKLIKTLNARVILQKDVRGDHFFRYVRDLDNLIDFLCAVHIFEHRVAFHFNCHREWTKITEIQDLLEELIEEEEKHLGWIEEYLKNLIKISDKTILPKIIKAENAEKENYLKELSIIEKNEELRGLYKVIKDKLIGFEKEYRWWKKI
ncbi:MAG: hypothetical protein AABY22_35770 [Nanoarchaeota archaeon]